jgi:enamine deaminase RidA (YjgF/YER057c/UK114 family)
MSNQRTRISSGSSFEKLAGYSRLVVDGEWIFVSGTSGFDYSTMTVSESAVEQAHQTFRNIAAALSQAGATLDDVVRVTYLLADAALFGELAPIFGEYLAVARPAATAMVVGMVDPRMKIEIEVTVRKSS